MQSRPRDSDLGMFTGSIKFFNKGKGFGFLILSDSREVFFHISGVQKDQDQADLKEGAQVACRLFEQHPDNRKGNGFYASQVVVTHL